MKGIGGETILHVLVPTGATSMTFFYSHTAIVDSFQVVINDALDNPERDFGPGTATCVQDCLQVSEGDVVKFRCSSPSGSQTCSLDDIQFYGSGARKLAKVDNAIDRPTPLPTSVPPDLKSAEKARDFTPISDSSSTPEFMCSKGNAGSLCPDETSSGKFNCCEKWRKEGGGYACETCYACKGWGQLLNGHDDKGQSCCHDSYLAEDTTIPCSDAVKMGKNIQCCKTKVGTATSNNPPLGAGTGEYYCHLDKRSSLGNEIYCISLADNPPYIHGKPDEEAEARKWKARKDSLIFQSNCCFIFATLTFIMYLLVVLWDQVLRRRYELPR